MSLYTLLDTLTQAASEDEEGLTDDNGGHGFESTIMDNWPKIRKEAISLKIFEDKLNREVLFKKIKDNIDVLFAKNKVQIEKLDTRLENKTDEEIQALRRAKEWEMSALEKNQIKIKEILMLVQRIFVTGESINEIFKAPLDDAFKEEILDKHNAVNLLEFWLVMHAYVCYAKEKNENFRSFDEIILESIDPKEQPSRGGYVTKVFTEVSSSHFFARLAAQDTQLTSPPTQNPSSLHNDEQKDKTSSPPQAKLGIAAIEKEIERFKENAKSLFNINNESKAKDLRDALDRAIANEAVTDVRLDMGVRKVLGRHRIFGFWDTTAIKNVNAELTKEGIAIPLENKMK